MKRFATLSLLIAAATAGQAQTFVDNARVRSVQPQYENVTVPRQECTSHWVTEPRRAAGPMQEYGPALIGGAAGAVLGRQVGKGSGRDAATVLGAVVGAYAGDQYANGNRWGQPVYEQREVQQCRTVNEVQSRLAGYHVAYDYRGQSHTAFLREHPGNHLQVRVSVEPVQTAHR